MPRLFWSPPALQDVQWLYRHLSEKNPVAAARAAQAAKVIGASVKIIAQQPGIGKPVEEMEPAYREWPINFGDSGYLVLYRWTASTVVILAVRQQHEAGY